ncbi:MAG TPA: hypothetical protein VMH20_07390 [Verrucomicrobiae bacterium]|nr:hypothetical protein [Verrucomicrobiae bacterium]
MSGAHRGILGLSLCISSLLLVGAAHAQDEDNLRGAPAERTDARQIRSQMNAVENLLGKTADRGAVLYFLAVSHARLGDILPAIDQLQKCVALKEGFDPSKDPAFAAINASGDFRKIVDQVHKDFPPVNDWRVAFTSTDKDLFPEGLEYDPANDFFYLSSLYHPKILRISPEGKIESFVSGQRTKLLPVMAIHLDPVDGTLWSTSFDEDAQRSEILHFDRAGELLGRYPSSEHFAHEFHDLAALRDGNLLVTDTLAAKVYRFDPRTQAFTTLPVSRPLFSPKGIALTDDEKAVYVADQLGILRIDLQTDTCVELDPGTHSTVAGIDGLYWHKDALIGVQSDIGNPRIAAFHVSADGLHVVKTTVLATSLASPTTGALRGDDFYFIVNSQADNLNGSHILDVTVLQPARIGVVHLP